MVMKVITVVCFFVALAFVLSLVSKPHVAASNPSSAQGVLLQN